MYKDIDIDVLEINQINVFSNQTSGPNICLNKSFIECDMRQLRMRSLVIYKGFFSTYHDSYILLMHTSRQSHSQKYTITIDKKLMTETK